jgi:hypothetical protein
MGSRDLGGIPASHGQGRGHEQGGPSDRGPSTPPRGRGQFGAGDGFIATLGGPWDGAAVAFVDGVGLGDLRVRRGAASIRRGYGAHRMGIAGTCADLLDPGHRRLPHR